MVSGTEAVGVIFVVETVVLKLEVLEDDEVVFLELELVVLLVVLQLEEEDDAVQGCLLAIAPPDIKVELFKMVSFYGKDLRE